VKKHVYRNHMVIRKKI